MMVTINNKTSENCVFDRKSCVCFVIGDDLFVYMNVMYFLKRFIEIPESCVFEYCFY